MITRAASNDGVFANRQVSAGVIKTRTSNTESLLGLIETMNTDPRCVHIYFESFICTQLEEKFPDVAKQVFELMKDHNYIT